MVLGLRDVKGRGLCPNSPTAQRPQRVPWEELATSSDVLLAVGWQFNVRCSQLLLQPGQPCQKSLHSNRSRSRGHVVQSAI